MISSVFTIAVSGMRSAETSLTASASNIANARSDGAIPGSAQAAASGETVYQPVDAQFQDQAGGGVASTLTGRRPGYSLAYDPNAAYADDAGMVATPDVDLGSELINVMMARTAYAANAKVAKIANDMTSTMLDTLGK